MCYFACYFLKIVLSLGSRLLRAGAEHNFCWLAFTFWSDCIDDQPQLAASVLHGLYVT